MQSQKMGTGRRTKIIREYRQTGGDGDRDGDTIVGIRTVLVGVGWGLIQNNIPCYPVLSIKTGALCINGVQVCVQCTATYVSSGTRIQSIIGDQLKVGQRIVSSLYVRIYR